MKDSGFTLINALEDALAEHKFQLVFTFLTKFDANETIKSANAKKQNLVHLLAIHGGSCPTGLVDKILGELLQKHALRPEAKDDSGRTPLHYSSEKGFQYLSRLLLERGLCPNDADAAGHTPLTLSVRANASSTASLELYVKHGGKLSTPYSAKVHSEDSEERRLTPLLHLFARRLKNQAVLDWYLKHGADINETEEKTGFDALHFAITNNSKNLVKFVLGKPDYN